MKNLAKEMNAIDYIEGCLLSLEKMPIEETDKNIFKIWLKSIKERIAESEKRKPINNETWEFRLTSSVRWEDEEEAKDDVITFIKGNLPEIARSENLLVNKWDLLDRMLFNRKHT